MDNDLIEMLQRAVEWDICLIEKAEDFNLDYPYAIDFECDSLFYPTREERDETYDLLLRIVPLLRGNFTIIKYFKEVE